MKLVIGSEVTAGARRHAAGRRSRIGALAAVVALAAIPVPRPAAAAEIRGVVSAPSPAARSETIVYVKRVPGRYPPKTVELDQRGMRFVPHILLITRGDTVRFLNHDDVPHNVYSLDHERYNLGTFQRGQTRTHTFAESLGVYAQYCSIHPDMVGYIFVGQNPYASKVDAKGGYSIRGVPPGRYTLEVWNPKLTAHAQSITVSKSGTVRANFSLRG